MDGGVAPYGRTQDGQEVQRVVIEDGLRAEILTYGGIIARLEVPDRAGRRDNVVLGLPDLATYEARNPNFGATVGRYAGRIAGARFVLDGVEHHLSANEGRNCLHGGKRGFAKRVWRLMEASGRRATLEYVSGDGEEGFPGELRAEVTFTVEANTLRLDYAAETDRPTVVNLTNHSYFNLAGEGSGDVFGHVLQVDAEAILEVDGEGIPTGRRLPVEGTPFDFRAPHPVGARIREAHPQILAGLGYDCCFLSERRGDAGGGDGARAAERPGHDGADGPALGATLHRQQADRRAGGAVRAGRIAPATGCAWRRSIFRTVRIIRTGPPSCCDTASASGRPPNIASPRGRLASERRWARRAAPFQHPRSCPLSPRLIAAAGCAVLLLQGCAEKPPTPSVAAEDTNEGIADNCSFSPVQPTPGGTVNATITMSNEGWCAYRATEKPGQPYLLGLVKKRPENGELLVRQLGGESRVEYNPNPGFVGTDSFTVALRPREQGQPDAIVQITATVNQKAGTAVVPPPANKTAPATSTRPTARSSSSAAKRRSGAVSGGCRGGLRRVASVWCRACVRVAQQDRAQDSWWLNWAARLETARWIRSKSGNATARWRLADPEPSPVALAGKV